MYFWSALSSILVAIHLNLFWFPFLPPGPVWERVRRVEMIFFYYFFFPFCGSIASWLRWCVDSPCLCSGVALCVALAGWLKPGRDTKQDRWFPTDFPSSSFIFHLTINSSVWMDTFTHGTKMNNNEIFNNSLHLHSL